MMKYTAAHPFQHKFTYLLYSLITLLMCVSIEVHSKSGENHKAKSNDDLPARFIESNAINGAFTVNHGELTLEFNDILYSRVNGMESFVPSESIEVKGNKLVKRFTIASSNKKTIVDEHGDGTQHVLVGQSDEGIEKRLLINTYDSLPDVAFFKLRYTNTSDEPIVVTRWINHHYLLPPFDDEGQIINRWAYQGATYVDRRDWIQPLGNGFYQENYMGMNASDYGSGTPVVNVWSQRSGLAIGHVETSPLLSALPLSNENTNAGSKGLDLRIELTKPIALEPGESFSTATTFVSVHRGDFYATLKMYRKVMADKGLQNAPVPDSAYEPIWCAWGYERDFTLDEVLNTLPTVKKLGLDWAVLDDGWQTSEGDWYLHPDKFPNGDKDMKAFVEQVKSHDLKAKLWWAPLAVDPGTDLLKEHPDMLLLNEDQSHRDITWWDSYYLCPAYEKTREYTKALVTKMIKEWGYAGLKIDGHHLNGVPPCHNPLHNHARPEESVEQLGEFWQMVYQTAIDIDPNAVVEICPCGTSYAFHNLPYMNQSVSSDPLSSWQIRLKGKTLKALMGESAPYYGDHVELSDNGSDFASSIGIGAIIGTKFTLPSDNAAAAAFLLTPEKQSQYTAWIDIYKNKMLPKGNYLGELYDIAFDRPETHVIEKDGALYYAFYADSFADFVEFRGLSQEGNYRVFDYVNGRDLGTVSASKPSLQLEFEQYLLVMLSKKSEQQ